MNSAYVRKLRFLKQTLFLFVILMLSNCEREIDPIPVITFEYPTTLTCHIESTCWNPASSSIDIGIRIPDGTYLRQSGSIRYESSDHSIASPDGSGVFQVKKPGQCKITAIQEAAMGYNASGRASFTLIVKPPLDPTATLKWYLSRFRDMYAPLYAGVGDIIENHAESSIPNGGKITYKSSNSEIATIDVFGKVKCLKVGIVDITASQEAKEGVNSESSIVFKLMVDPVPQITFSQGNDYIVELGTSIKYRNVATSSIINGGD
jgi:hypothetical protein